MSSTAHQTPREKLIARTNSIPLRALASALLTLDAKPRLDDAEMLTRSVMIDSITGRCPAADAAFDAWAATDDDPRTAVEVIAAAVRGA